MARKSSTSSTPTFLIKIRSTEHNSWQGTLEWTNTRRTENFRSALEMIKLIDSAVAISEEDRAETDTIQADTQSRNEED